MKYFIFQPVSFEPRYICARPWAGPWGKTVNGADTVQPFWNLLSCLVYRQIGFCEKGCDRQSIDVIEVHMRKAEFSLRQLGEAFLKQRTREDSLPPTEWVINRSWPEEGDSVTWERVSQTEETAGVAHRKVKMKREWPETSGKTTLRNNLEYQSKQTNNFLNRLLPHH